MIAELIEDLKKDEGWLPYAYDDLTGQPVTCEGWVTIGWGFMIDQRLGGEVPKPVAEFWLEYAVEQRWEALMDERPWIVEQPPNVQRALGNMAYQLGVAGVLKFEDMLDALQEGDRELAYKEALNSRWASQTPSRAQRVASMLRGEPQ